MQYLDDQERAAGAVPDDRTILIEQSRDDLGDWRVAVLSPLGSRVHAPWAMAVTARIRDEAGVDVEVMWSDEGFVVRYPDGQRLPDPSWLLPDPDEVERLVVRQLGSTSMFAARFREAAGRALLLPRRRPGARAPLWQLRKRASDLLAVAAQHGSFPIVLETYRECLRDIFDLPALTDILSRVRSRAICVVHFESATPSPFSKSLLFGYVANYLYDGDAPLAERRAQALSVDQSQLRELIGDSELRDLLDAGVLASLEADLQYLPSRLHARSADALHDRLLRLGDLSLDEINLRSQAGDATATMAELVENRRAIEVRIAGEPRLIAVEDATRFRDAIGTPLPPGLPDALLEPVADPIGDLVHRYARTHGPFVSQEVSVRLGLGGAVVEAALVRLRASGRVLDGQFRPGGHGREWCDAEVLRNVRQRSLAKLRQEVAPVDAGALGRFLVEWHGLSRPRSGLDGLLDVIEQLQGVPLVASLLDREVLSARVRDYSPAMLDTLMGAGEVTWVGVEPLGERDGRLALYLTDQAALLRPPQALDPARQQGLADRDARIVAFLERNGLRSLDRSTMRPVAAFRKKQCQHSGNSSGKAWLPTTHCMHCGASRRRWNVGGVRAARHSDRAGWYHRLQKADGRWRLPLRVPPLRGPRRRRTNCWPGTAWSHATVPPSNTYLAAFRRSIRCCDGWRKPAAFAAATLWRVSAPRSSLRRVRSTCCARHATLGIAK